MNRFSIRERTIFIFLSLLGLLAYVNTFQVPFHYDDFHFLKENIHIKSAAFFWDWLTNNPTAIITGRAFLLFTFLINYLINGLDTFGYHIVNIFIHISTACLFYVLVSTYITKEKNPQPDIKALIASAIFLLHPINTESVTYISSRSSELSTLLMLASMIMFFSATASKFAIGPYLFSICLYVLAVSTKQNTFVMPVLLVLMDAYFVSNRNELKKRLTYHIPFLAILSAGFFFYLPYLSHPEMYDRPWLTHVLTEFKVFILYLRLLLVPVGLNIDYSVKESVSFDAASLAAIVTVLALLVAAVTLKNKNRLLSFSCLWFFVNIGPLLALRLSDYMTDRWAYAASLGFALGLSELLVMLIRNYRKPGIAVVTAIALSFGVMTYMRNEVYKDPIALWSDALRKSPDKIRPYTNLSASYLEQGDIDKSIEIMKLSIKRGNRAPEAFMNLAMAYFTKGDLRAAEGIMMSVPERESATYNYNLGVIYKSAKKYRQAIDVLKKARKQNPLSPSILESIGECYKLRGNRSAAEEYFIAATKGTPQTGEDYLELARSYFELKQNDKGVRSLRAALLADPLNISIRNIIATSLLEQNYYDEAYRHFSVMAKISPRFAAAYKGMGVAMLKKGNVQGARKNFQKAISLLPPGTPERTDIEKLLSAV